MSVQELEKAVTQLSTSELEEFTQWFADYRQDEWNKQIAEDSAAGRLDKHIQQAHQDFESGRSQLTIAERIIRAVAVIVAQDDKIIFSREDVRSQAGVSRENWDASYSPIFQGMRADQPGGAPNVTDKYKNVFQQVKHGEHMLTDYGRQAVAELSAKS